LFLEARIFSVSLCLCASVAILDFCLLCFLCLLRNREQARGFQGDKTDRLGRAGFEHQARLRHERVEEKPPPAHGMRWRARGQMPWRMRHRARWRVGEGQHGMPLGEAQQAPAAADKGAAGFLLAQLFVVETVGEARNHQTAGAAAGHLRADVVEDRGHLEGREGAGDAQPLEQRRGVEPLAPGPLGQPVEVEAVGPVHGGHGFALFEPRSTERQGQRRCPRLADHQGQPRRPGYEVRPDMAVGEALGRFRRGFLNHFPSRRRRQQ